MFYVYMHTRLDNGKPFYIGKGKLLRAWDYRRRSKDWKTIELAHGVSTTILKENLTEHQAFSLEIAMIALIGRANLVNKSNGGEGPSGAVPSIGTRLKMAEAQRGRKHPEHVKAKIAASHIGMKYGEETRRKLSEKAKQRKASPETCAKNSKRLQGNTHARDFTKHVFEHKSGAVFVGQAHYFGLIVNEHPSKLIKGKKPHIKGWCYRGVHSIE